ncbi:PAS domain-containing protein [Candidatus Uhrbacteria bacterium]|nr:PAS domain-containing protein [Candidatus Uhrbacteria bacterium]
MKQSDIAADELWKVAWTYIRTVVDTVREPFLVLGDELNILSANRTFYAFFQTTAQETEGKKVYDLGNGQWNIPKLKILLEDILPNNTFFEDFRVEHNFPGIGFRIMMLNARQVFTVDNKTPIVLLAMEDITKQVELEDKMKKYTEELTREVAKRTTELEARVKELETLNETMIGREVKMVELKKEIEDLKARITNNEDRSALSGHDDNF